MKAAQRPSSEVEASVTLRPLDIVSCVVDQLLVPEPQKVTALVFDRLGLKEQDPFDFGRFDLEHQKPLPTPK
jgi:hypothetical protein